MHSFAPLWDFLLWSIELLITARGSKHWQQQESSHLTVCCPLREGRPRRWAVDCKHTINSYLWTRLEIVFPKEHVIILSCYLKYNIIVATAVPFLPIFSFLLAEGVTSNSAGMKYNYYGDNLVLNLLKLQILPPLVFSWKMDKVDVFSCEEAPSKVTKGNLFH